MRQPELLWCVVRAGAEIAAGAICTGDGGFVHGLFTRRPWRKQGVGTALLGDAFRRFWARGERSVGLGVDTESATGAFRLYKRPGWCPCSAGWCTRKGFWSFKQSISEGRDFQFGGCAVGDHQ